MKKLTNALNTGELKPRDRVLLLVHDDVAKETTGNAALTEADRHAIGEGWRPQTSEQAREYNRYMEGWRVMGCAELDAQTAFLNTQTEHFRKQPFILNLRYYSYNRQMRSALKRLSEIKCVNVPEAVEIVEMQKAVKLRDGLDFDYALYRLAFERLSPEDRESLNELYVDIETDHQYLDQEEIIANLVSKDGTVTQKNKERLAALVASRSYNAFAKEYQLFHYFACIPLAEVARRFLASKEVLIKGKPLAQDQGADDEDTSTHKDIQKAMEQYAKEHGVTIEAMLKEACLVWLDGDLFEEYRPLALSDSRDLFTRWLNAKKEAAALLKGHIVKGELNVRDRSPDESRRDQLYGKRLYDAELEKARQAMETMGLELNPEEKGELDEKVAFVSFSRKVLTGESLYAFTGDYAFVAEFKENADTYNANLGLVYADDDPKHTGNHLDQELLIADKNNAGELNIFSSYGMATRLLDTLLESQIYFKETETEDGLALEFKSPALKGAFILMKDELIEGYATFLAFEEVFKRLSRIYEVDLGYRAKKWLVSLGEYIDQHNEALKEAAGLVEDESDFPFRRYGPPLHVDESLLIDKEKIKPSRGKVLMYFEKLKEVLGEEFGSYEEPDEETSA